MIQFADQHTLCSVRSMWKTCFQDTDEYIELFFSRQYKDENTLVWIEDGIVVASLQMTFYTLNVNGEKIPFYYLVGLCTLPEYRNKGYMSQLIYKAFEVMRERNIPLSILVPADDWLFEYYNRFGFYKCSQKGRMPLPSVKEVLDNTSTFEEAYAVFDEKFNQRDFCVQKTFYDFGTIVQDLSSDGFPDKYNIAAMACIIDEDLIDKNIFRDEQILIDLMLE